MWAKYFVLLLQTDYSIICIYVLYMHHAHAITLLIFLPRIISKLFSSCCVVRKKSSDTIPKPTRVIHFKQVTHFMDDDVLRQLDRKKQDAIVEI